MRTLEVRRHTHTKKDETRGRGSQISQAGVALAKKIGAAIRPFDRVVVSPIPRTSETALAMGFAVDEIAPQLGELDASFWEEVGRHDHWSWPQPFVRYVQLIGQGGRVAAVGRVQAEIWRQSLAAVPAGGAVLIISHGHAIEAGLVTCFPTARLEELGTPFGHCEGFRARYEQGMFSDLELLRHGGNSD